MEEEEICGEERFLVFAQERLFGFMNTEIQKSKRKIKFDLKKRRRERREEAFVRTMAPHTCATSGIKAWAIQRTSDDTFGI
jgi:hypothetical protein